MVTQIKISRTKHSRISEIDFKNLQFGSQFSDHMFAMEYTDGQWQNHRIEPFGLIEVHPVSATLHYGQTIFEGTKAYRGVDGKIRHFRLDMNHKRLTDSCIRMCMPPVELETFLSAIEELIRVDQQWVPPYEGQALYVRPVLFADEGSLDVRPANRYRFLIITSPVRGYFGADSPAVALKAEGKYTRAFQGGTGSAKVGGNYGATFLASSQGQDEGYAQILWLDGVEHRYIEEAGQMNICFVLDGKLVTPPLKGTILPGVTRDSVIQLTRDMGIECEERMIDINEVIDGIKNQTLQEAFGCGTAVVVNAVGSIGYRGQQYEIGNGKIGPLSQELYKLILGIQRGEVEDTHNWTREVAIS